MSDDLARFQTDFLGLLFSRDPASHLARIRAAYGDSAVVPSHARWPVYRRMARDRIREAVFAALPRTLRLLGRDALGFLVDEWLAESPPESPYLRDLSHELAVFLDEHPAGRRLAPAGVDPIFRTLLRYEAALFAIGHAEDNLDRQSIAPLAMDRPLVFSPAHVRLSLDADVTALSGDFDASDVASVSRQPTELVIHRDEEGEVHTRILDARAAWLFDALTDGSHRSVVEAAHLVADRARLTVDGEFVAALTDVLTDWLERGLLVGAQ